ncbi:unnamed protein product [Hyaloperonospora brassicae]|uniref:Uncharacterized protein n=1 Tax=Hyaloperonospora brassicae TaxID=162125 RepID=A0AAV0UEC2_HYABA|nr:unnamed protein product [Hyaloperonospora brassicae]
MQNQVEVLCLDGSVEDVDMTMQEGGNEAAEVRGQDAAFSTTFDGKATAGDDQEATRAVSSDGSGFCTSDKWAELYKTTEMAVVTDMGHPPVPSEGYMPLRHGRRCGPQSAETCTTVDADVPSGSSGDTLLWSEEVLEQRILQLTAWTRRGPVPRRQELKRINRMLSSSGATISKSC